MGVSQVCALLDEVRKAAAGRYLDDSELAISEIAYRVGFKNFYVITRYNRIKAKPDEHWVPRTAMFAGKSAPGYAMAKAIIRLINNVSTTINQEANAEPLAFLQREQ